MASIGKLNVFTFLNFMLFLKRMATPPQSLSLSFRKIFHFFMFRILSVFRLVSDSRTTPASPQLSFKNKSNKSFLFNPLIDCTFKATISLYIVHDLWVPWLYSDFPTFEPFDFEIELAILKIYRTYLRDSNRV